MTNDPTRIIFSATRHRRNRFPYKVYTIEIEYSRSVLLLLVIDWLVAAEAAPLTDLVIGKEGTGEGCGGSRGGEHDGRLGGALGYDARILIAPP